MTACLNLFTLTSILTLLIGPSVLCAGEPMTDAQKRSAVYQMYAEYKQVFPEVSDISPSDARSAFAKGKIQFVDVRKPEEIRISTLPGAIDRETFMQSTGHYKDKTVVVFCTISYRSGVFAQEMARQGIAVENLTGGILAWVLEGGKVFDDGGVSKRLHVYGPKWDLAPADFETTKFGLLDRLKQ